MITAAGWQSAALVAQILIVCTFGYGSELLRKGKNEMSLQPVSKLFAAQSRVGGRLIVVSNRLPLTLRKTEDGWTTESSAGGLASAMNPLLRKGGGDWIGWAGGGEGEDSESRRAILAEWAETRGCFAVDLPAEVAARFYEGYANQTLWPVFHSFPSQLKFESKTWEAYVEANRIFCEAVVQRHEPNDLIWVHDYHLMLLPQMLRDKLPDAAIGFFLHIPFPSSEIFPVLPRRGEVLPPCGSPAPSDRLTVAQFSLILFSYLPGKSPAIPTFQTPASSPGRDFSGSPCLGFA